MKILVACYSLTGQNRHIAGEICKKTGAEMEEIIDTVERPKLSKNGMADGKPPDAMKVFSTMFSVFFKRGTKIKPPEKNPAEYDIVVFGSPYWAGGLPPATRTYAKYLRGKAKRLALFCVDGQTDPRSMFDEIGRICGMDAAERMWLTEKEVEVDGHVAKIEEFARKISRSPP